MVSKEQAKKNKAKEARARAAESKSEEQKSTERELNRLSKQKSRSEQSAKAHELLKEKVLYPDHPNNLYHFGF